MSKDNEKYFEDIDYDVKLSAKKEQLENMENDLSPVDRAVATITTFVGLMAGDSIDSPTDITVIKAAVAKACYDSVAKNELENEIKELEDEK